MQKRSLTIIVIALLCALVTAFALVGCGKVDFKLDFIVDGEVCATISTNGEEAIKLPDNPKKDGYIFDGWYWDNEIWKKPFTANSLLDTPLSSDMSVYAKFEKEEAVKGTQAEFVGFEKVGENKYFKKVSNDTEIFSLGTLVKVNSKSNWIASYDVSCTKVILSKIVELTAGDNFCYVNVTDENGNMSLYTLNIRRREIYEVSFADSDVQSQYIEEDSCAVAPSTANRNGYTFKSWDFDFSAPIVENTVISAKWNVITYNIEYVLNGGENNSLNPTIYTIESENIVLQSPNKTGYDFAGWYVNEALTEKVEKIVACSYGNKKFYAKWDKSIFKYTNNGKIIGLYVNCQTVTELDIPSTINGTTITGIFDSAFSGCSELISITIPKGVTSIGSLAFKGCSKLETIYYNGYLENWCEIIGLNNIMSSSRTLYIGGKKVEGELVIPDSVTSIGNSAFKGCTGLTSVTIHNGVTIIGESAFEGCLELNRIYYKGSIAGWCEIIGLNNIMSSSRMSSSRTLYIGGKKVEGKLVIPDSVKSIGYCAFYGCTGLTSVTIPKGVESIRDYSFYECDGLKTIYYTGDIASWCRITGLYNIMLRRYQTLYIGGKKVEGILVIPDSVRSIGGSAFEGCAGLTSVTIGNSVTSIGSRAFISCSGLTSVTIPNSVTSIGNNAFSGCTGLTSVTIPDSVTSIDSSAFCDCTGLTSVTIPDSVTSIGDFAFYRCTGLISVTIPNSVVEIDYYAFSGCSSLKTIYYKGTEEQWNAITKGSGWNENTGNYTIVYNA